MCPPWGIVNPQTGQHIHQFVEQCVRHEGSLIHRQVNTFTSLWSNVSATRDRYSTDRSTHSPVCGAMCPPWGIVNPQTGQHIHQFVEQCVHHEGSLIHRQVNTFTSLWSNMSAMRDRYSTQSTHSPVCGAMCPPRGIVNPQTGQHIHQFVEQCVRHEGSLIHRQVNTFTSLWSNVSATRDR